MVQANPIMDLLQADMAGGLAAWALVASFVALLAVLCIMLFLRKSSDRARNIIGIVVGIIGLYNMTFPVIALLDGASLSQYVVSNIFVGVALIFLSSGSIFHEYNTPFALIFLVLIGPGIFLMIGSWAGSVFPSSYLLVLGLIWALAWVALIAVFIYGYLKKPKNTPTE